MSVTHGGEVLCRATVCASGLVGWKGETPGDVHLVSLDQSVLWVCVLVCVCVCV